MSFKNHLEEKLKESKQYLSEDKDTRNEISQIEMDLDEIAKRIRRLKSNNTAFG